MVITRNHYLKDGECTREEEEELITQCEDYVTNYRKQFFKDTEEDYNKTLFLKSYKCIKKYEKKYNKEII